MQSRIADFRSAGADVVAISSSSFEDHARIAAGKDVGFPILSDPQGEVIRSYGLLHEGALPFSARPVARPAVFILDGDGTIRKRFLTENWRIRERPEHLLAELASLR